MSNTTLKATMKKSKQRSQGLREQAEENLSIQKGNKTMGFNSIKPGVHIDPNHKHSPVKQTERVIGVSKGVTKNMDNFESLRVDCWLSDTVHQDETVEEAFNRVGEIIDKVLEDAVLSVVDEK